MDAISLSASPKYHTQLDGEIIFILKNCTVKVAFAFLPFYDLPVSHPPTPIPKKLPTKATTIDQKASSSETQAKMPQLSQ